MDRGAASYWAEFLGTFTLCFVGQGAICAQELLGPQGPGLLGIAIAHGLALAVMVSALGAVSGAHFNPAVTLGFLVTRRQSAASALRYAAAQLAGAVVASYLISVFWPRSVWEAVRLGAAVLQTEVPAPAGAVIEMILTFLLVTAVWGTAVDERAPRIGGFGIGLAVTMGILVGGPLTGAALNPARAFGAALVAGAWENHWVWWIGPLLGGAAGAAAYRRFVLPGARS